MSFGACAYATDDDTTTDATSTAITVTGGGWGGVTDIKSSSGLSSTSIVKIIVTAMKWLLYLVGFFAVIAFVISGILYLTAAGDDDRIDRAKTTMIYAIVGVIVALMGVIIINAVNIWFGGTTAVF